MSTNEKIYAIKGQFWMEDMQHYSPIIVYPFFFNTLEKVQSWMHDNNFKLVKYSDNKTINDFDFRKDNGDSANIIPLDRYEDICSQ